MVYLFSPDSGQNSALPYCFKDNKYELHLSNLQQIIFQPLTGPETMPHFPANW
jgi:hypothetical protein